MFPTALSDTYYTIINCGLQNEISIDSIIAANGRKDCPERFARRLNEPSFTSIFRLTGTDTAWPRLLALPIGRTNRHYKQCDFDLAVTDSNG